MKTQLQKSLIHNIQSLNEFEKRVLIEDLKVKSLPDLKNLPDSRIITHFKKYSIPKWQKEDQKTLIQKVRDIKREATHLQTGRTLRNQIPHLSGEVAEKIADKGYYTIEQIAGEKLENLSRSLTGVAKKDLLDIKRRANLSVAGLVPPEFISILESCKVESLTELCLVRDSKLVECLCGKLKALSNAQLRTVVHRLYDYYNNINDQLSYTSRIDFKIESQTVLQAIIKSLETIITSENYTKKEICQVLELILKLIRINVCRERFPDEEEIPGPKPCECDWDNSVFSEKAYLFYLLETFYEGGQTLVDMGIDIGNLDSTNETTCFTENLVQTLITKLQRDLRVNKKQFLIPPTFEDSDIRFLSFSQWQTMVLYRYYPELKYVSYFTQELPALPGFIVHESDPGDSPETSFEYNIARINDWTSSLNSILTGTSKFQARAYWWGYLDEVLNLDDPPGWALEVKKQWIVHEDRIDDGSWDTKEDIRIKESEGGNIHLSDIFGRYSDIFGGFYTFYTGVYHSIKQIFGPQEGEDPTIASSENAISAKSLILAALESLETVKEGFGPSFSHSHFKTIKSGGFRPDQSVEQFKDNGAISYRQYVTTLSGLSFDASQHWQKCLALLNSYFLFQNGFISTGYASIPIPSKFYLEDAYGSAKPKGLERLKSALSLPDTEGLLEGYSGRHVIKLFDHVGFDDTLFSLRPVYSGFMVETGSSASGTDYFEYVASQLNSQTEITNDLRIELVGTDSIAWIDIDEAKFPDLESLRNILLQFIYHLPYLKQFIVPILYAEIFRAQEDYEEAIRWLSLIHDTSMVACPVILPFELTAAEKNLSKTILSQTYLDMADQLYRRDTYESITQAEELYARIISLLDIETCCEVNELDVLQIGKLEGLCKMIKNARGRGVKMVIIHQFRDLMKKIHPSLIDAEIREEVTKLQTGSKKSLNKYEEELEAFIGKYKKHLTNTIPVGDHIAKRNSFSSRIISREAGWSIKSPLPKEQYIWTSVGYVDFGNLGKSKDLDYYSFDSEKNDPGTSEEKIYLSDPDASAALPPDIIDIQFQPVKPLAEAYGLCVYPNPRLVAIVSEACWRLKNIKECRNYFGYRQDDTSIYTYEELLKKSRHYLNIAITLEKDYLSFYESWQSEREKRLLSFRNLLNSEANIVLGELIVNEAHENQVLADLQYEAADNAVQDAERVQAFRNAPPVLAVRFWNTGFQGASGGASSGGAMGPAGMAIGAGLGMLSSMFNFAEEMMNYENQLNRLRDQRMIADQGRNVAAARMEVARQQLNIYHLDLMLSNAQLNMLLNKAIGAETYHALFREARRLYKKYVDFSTRFAWLAERELEFIRGVEINTIRFNYYQYQNQGLLAAKMLQDDVESMNNQKEITEQNFIVTHSNISLANSFPLHFQEFLQTGILNFITSNDYLNLQVKDGVLTYLGHYNYPREWGHIDQRITGIELKFYGLIGPTQDIHVTLMNPGLSVVMRESDENEVGIEPVLLRRHPQRVVFNKAQGDSTFALYTHEEGIRLPFEGSGVDTNWVLSIEKGSTALDLRNLVDIEMTIYYEAKYSDRYRAVQEEKDTTGNYIRLPERLARTRVFAFASGELVDQFYSFQNPAQPSGFRDLRIVTFNTRSEDFGPNEGSQSIDEVTLYAKSTSLAGSSPVFKLSSGLLDVTNKTFGNVSTDFQNQIEYPPGSGAFIPARGYVDSTNLALASGGDPARGLNRLIQKNKAVEREWTIKVFPENLSEPFISKNMAGETLNTRGETVNSVTDTDILTGIQNTGDRRLSLNINSNEREIWDNYHTQFKVWIDEGTFICMLNSYDSIGIYVQIKPNIDKGIEIGSFNGSTLSQASSTPAWPNPINWYINTNEWYLVDCLSILTGNANERFVRLTIDGTVVWEGVVALDPQTGNGGIEFQIKGKTSLKIDDILVKRIDNSGSEIRELFADTCDGKKASHWTGLQTSASAPGFVLKEDKNLAMDLSGIDDLFFILNYSFEVK